MEWFNLKWNCYFCRLQIESKDIGKYIKQAEWEQYMWDKKEEEALVNLYAAQLRAFLTAANGSIIDGVMI